jgi:hypothetical protein
MHYCFDTPKRSHNASKSRLRLVYKQHSGSSIQQQYVFNKWQNCDDSNKAQRGLWWGMTSHLQTRQLWVKIVFLSCVSKGVMQWIEIWALMITYKWVKSYIQCLKLFVEHVVSKLFQQNWFVNLSNDFDDNKVLKVPLDMLIFA